MSQLTHFSLIAEVLYESINLEFREAVKEGNTSRLKLLSFPPATIYHLLKLIREKGLPSASIGIRYDTFYNQDLLDFPEYSLGDQETFTYLRTSTNYELRLFILASENHGEIESLQSTETVSPQDLLTSSSFEKAIKLVPDFFLPTLNDTKRSSFITLLEMVVKNCKPNLEQLYDYILTVSQYLEEETINTACGLSLPTLRAFKWKKAFTGIDFDNGIEKNHKVKQRILEAVTTNAYYARLRDKNGNPIKVDLLKQNLQVAVEEGLIDKENEPILTEFINRSAQDLFTFGFPTHLDYDLDGLTSLYQGIKLASPKLGALTKEFFVEEAVELVAEETKLLSDLDRVKKKEIGDLKPQLQKFYEDYRTSLELKPTLCNKWEKLLFSRNISDPDLLVCLINLVDALRDHLFASSNYQLEVAISPIKPRTLFKTYSFASLEYLATRYKNLDKAFSGLPIEINFGPLADWEGLIAQHSQKAEYKSFFQGERTGKAANEIKFTAAVVDKSTKQKITTQSFIWTFSPNSILVGTKHDLEVHQENPVRSYEVYAQSTASNSSQLIVSLDNKSSFSTFKSGYFVTKAGSNVVDHKKEIRRYLSDFQSRGLISADTAEEITQVMTIFERSYSNAIKGFLNDGLLWSGYKSFASDYEKVSETLLSICSDPKNRLFQKLLGSFVRVGCVITRGAAVSAIIPPFHPLRLIAIGIKNARFVELVNQLLNESLPPSCYIDYKMYIDDRIAEFQHPFFPELITLSGDFTKGIAKTLSSVAQLGDFSLLECLEFSESSDDLRNYNSIEGVDTLIKVVRQFLELYPHEKSNLSILLHSIDNVLFPEKLVEKITNSSDSVLSDTQCQIILRDLKEERLRQIYESFLESFDSDNETIGDGFSELNFISKLRINAYSKVLDSKDHQQDIDIGFMIDQVARRALTKVSQVDANIYKCPEIDTFKPTIWSRKKPYNPRQSTAGTFLTSPVAPDFYNTYLDISAKLYDSHRDYHNDGEYLRIERMVDYDEKSIKSLINEMHENCYWVVNLDEVVDRRQLRQMGVNVIKYRQARNLNLRNLVITSNGRMDIVTNTLKRKLSTIGVLPTSSEIEISNIVDELIQDANILSGGLVLKSLGSDNYSNELLGLVLSKRLIESELKVDQPGVSPVWVHLDDYSDWFLRSNISEEADLAKEQKAISDLLCILPEENASTGVIKLKFFIVESKFVNSSAKDKHKTKSLQQLKTTFNRFNKIFFDSTEYLDKAYWLARISDLIVECGEGLYKNTQMSSDVLRQLIREDKVEYEMWSVSHVFVYDSSDDSIIFDYEPGISQWLLNGRAISSILTNKTLPDELQESLRIGKTLEPLVYRLTPSKVDELVEKSLVVATIPNPTESALHKIDSDEKESSDKSPEASLGQSEDLSVSPIPETLPEEPIGDIHSFVEHVATSNNMVIDDNVRATIEKGVRTILINKGISAQLGETTLTPNSYRILLKGQPKITSKFLMGLHDEFLTCTHNIMLDLYNVEALPGYYALFFRRENRGIVYYADCLRERIQNEGVNTTSTKILLGRRENDSSLVFWNFDSDEPHGLCGGMTGSGKSETLTTIITDLMINNSPNALELVLIDPKRTEFGKFNDFPHLHGKPVIKDKDEAIRVVQSLVTEVDDRYRLLEQHGVNKISQLPQGLLKRKFVIFDEVARWMADEEFKRVIESSIEELGNVARAAGVHLLLCTQRPDNDVVSPQTRQSLGAKLALKVDRDKNSVIILGEPGAENLMGNGHMIAVLGGDKIYLQTAYLPPQHFNSFKAFLAAKLEN